MNDSNENFGSADDASANAHSDALLESRLNERGARMRLHPQLSERIVGATHGIVSSAGSMRFRAVRQQQRRWVSGLALAASLLLAFVVVNFFSSRDGKDVSIYVVTSVDRSVPVSEPFLVSLIAGSELVASDESQEVFEGDPSAMPMLRTRDASFHSIHSEVQQVVIALAVK